MCCAASVNMKRACCRWVADKRGSLLDEDEEEEVVEEEEEEEAEEEEARRASKQPRPVFSTNLAVVDANVDMAI